MFVCNMCRTSTRRMYRLVFVLIQYTKAGISLYEETPHVA